MRAATAWLLTWVQAQTLGLRSLHALVSAWGRRHPRWRTAARVTGIAAVAQLVVATAAYAAGEEKKATNPFLDSFGVADTDGNSVSKYDLSLGGGSDGLLPGTSDIIDPILQTWVVVGWEVYRIMVTLALWFLDIALQYRVLDTLRPAANTIANGLQSTVGALGIVPIFLIVSFIGMLYWILQRRSGAGAFDFFLSLLFAALLTTALANPVDWITGDDGLMTGSRDVGIAAAVQITSGGQESTSDGEQLRQQTTGMLADKFIRIPHQLINYGAIIEDDGKCKKAYEDVIKNAPYKDKEDAKKKIGTCNEQYEAAADDPGQALTGMIVLTPAGAIVVLLAGILGLITLSFNLIALYIGAKTVLDILRAILPGGSKASVLVNLASLLALAVATVLLLVIIGAFLVFVEALFDGYKQAGLTLIEAFVLLDLIMLVAIAALLIFWFKSLRSGKKLGDKIHKAVAPKPVSPAPSHGMRAMSMASSKASGLATMTGYRMGAARNESPSGGQDERTPTFGSVNRTGAQPTSKASLLTRVGQGAGTGSLKAVKYAAMATVGAPVYAPRAASAAKSAMTAKRAAMSSSLQATKNRARNKVRSTATDAKSFGREYAHNLGTAGRFVGRASGATHLASWAITAGVNPIAAGAMAAGTMFAGSHKPSNPAPAKARTNPAPSESTSAPPPPGGHSATEFMLKTTTAAATATNTPSTKTTPAAPTVAGAGAASVPQMQVRQADIDRDELQAGRERLMAKMRERGARQRMPMAVGDQR